VDAWRSPVPRQNDDQLLNQQLANRAVTSLKSEAQYSQSFGAAQETAAEFFRKRAGKSKGAACFAMRPVSPQKFSILLDTHILREQARAEISPFEARLPLRSPSAVSLLAKLRIER